MFHYEGLAADWCSIVRICREGARGGPLYGPHPAHWPFVTPLYGYRNYILAGGEEVTEGVLSCLRFAILISTCIFQPIQ